MSRVPKVIAAHLIAFAITILAAPTALAQFGGEAIRSYDLQIEVRTDDSLRITETIVYDFGGSQDHGIFRDVPTRLTFNDRFDRVYPLHVESVTASGDTPAQYDVSNEPGGITRIKIGDPDRTITGVHTYTIVYTVFPHAGTVTIL